jgi:hypothetical protein
MLYRPSSKTQPLASLIPFVGIIARGFLFKDNSMKKIFRFFSALIILTMACAVPGLSTASPPSAPTVDTRLENMIPLTVSAAQTQTQQAQPTQTSVPTHTAQPTPTSTPEADSASSILVKNDDGSFLFTDELGKYQITIPQELLALRINQQEYLDAWLLPAASNAAIQNQLNLIQKQDPNRFRLFAFDFNEEHIESGFITNLNFLWDDAANLSTEEQLLKATNEYLQAFPGAEIIETKSVVLQNQTLVGLVKFKNPVTTLEGTEINVIQKQAFVLLPKGILVITLSSAESQIEFVEALFDEMLETFNLVDGAVN